jgi:hypothetical protein
MSDKNLNQIGSAMTERVLSIIRRPQQAVKEKRAWNKAPIALVGFNLVMVFLDLVSALTVAMLTSWMYGVMTFIAGVLALFLWEQLFTNPHANMMQKWISVGGGVLAVFSTLGIGIMAGIANVVGVSGVIGRSTIEIVMIVSMVVIAFVHGTAWGVYYFTDPSHKAQMNRMTSLAYRDQQKQGLEDAKSDLAQALEIHKELAEYEKAGQLELLNASYQEMRGTSLMTAPPLPSTEIPPLAVQPGTGFVPKASEVSSPLSERGKPES